MDLLRWLLCFGREAAFVRKREAQALFPGQDPAWPSELFSPGPSALGLLIWSGSRFREKAGGPSSLSRPGSGMAVRALFPWSFWVGSFDLVG